MKTIIIVLGLLGSGKSEVANTIRREGIPIFRMGDIVREEIARRGLKDTLELEEKIAVELREKFGRDAVAQRMAEKLKNTREDLVCLDGPRNIEELELFSKIGRIVLLVVNTPEETRFKRLLKRRRSRDPKTMQEFRWRHKKNLQLGIKRVLETRAFPRYEIENTGSLEELRKKVKNTLKEIITKY